MNKNDNNPKKFNDYSKKIVDSYKNLYDLYNQDYLQKLMNSYTSLNFQMIENIYSNFNFIQNSILERYSELISDSVNSFYKNNFNKIYEMTNNIILHDINKLMTTVEISQDTYNRLYSIIERYEIKIPEKVADDNVIKEKKKLTLDQLLAIISIILSIFCYTDDKISSIEESKKYEEMQSTVETLVQIVSDIEEKIDSSDELELPVTLKNETESQNKISD